MKAVLHFQIKLTNSEGKVVPIGEQGEIQVRGHNYARLLERRGENQRNEK